MNFKNLGKIGFAFFLLKGIFWLFIFAKSSDFLTKNNQNNMKVAVWDTYVTKKNGEIMHFDIIAPDNVKNTETIYGYGRAYLATKGQEGQSLTSKECRFCHIESLRPAWADLIAKQGYFIIEMEGCN